ncbi:hypothetical protein, partial [Nonomuraea deserti]|uniref:hypothetical protein n=1 Tax=Nonomuraea deserti TaxID=1848322 RepID=UPI001C70762C
ALGTTGILTTGPSNTSTTLRPTGILTTEPSSTPTALGTTGILTTGPSNTSTTLRPTGILTTEPSSTPTALGTTGILAAGLSRNVAVFPEPAGDGVSWSGLPGAAVEAPARCLSGERPGTGARSEVTGARIAGGWVGSGPAG